MAENVEPPRREIREPRDAELAARDWMRWIGYDDAKLTQGGADGGVDVVATGAVAQVKAEAAPVGRPAIQQLFGIAQIEEATALFFSWGGYSEGAESWADRAGVALFTLNMLGEVEPENDPGIAIVARAEVTGDRLLVWDEAADPVDPAEVSRWISERRASHLYESWNPSYDESSLVVVHRETFDLDDGSRRHYWIRFTVAGEYGSPLSMRCGGFSDDDVEAGYEMLGLDVDEAPLGKDGNLLAADNSRGVGPWGVAVYWVVNWSGDPRSLIKLVKAVAKHAKVPLNDGDWRLGALP